MKKRLALVSVLVLVLSLVLGSFAFADTVGPTITGIGKSAASVYVEKCPTNPHTVMVQARVTDADGLAEVEVEWKYAGAAGWNDVPMTLRADGYWRATIGPFPTAGTVQFRIFTEDTADNVTISGVMTLPVIGCDLQAPTISDVSTGAPQLTEDGDEACAGMPMTTYVQATVYDPSGLKYVRLYYRAPGSAVWSFVPMTRYVNNTFRATLGPFTEEGVARYYVKAVDKLNNGPAKSATRGMPVVECP